MGDGDIDGDRRRMEMKGVEVEVDLVAVEGGGEEASLVAGDHVELRACGLADNPDNRVVT